MKHLKAINNKALKLDQAAAENRIEEVVAMSSVAGCASTTDPVGKSTPLAVCRRCASRWKRIFMAVPTRAGGRPRCPT